MSTELTYPRGLLALFILAMFLTLPSLLTFAQDPPYNATVQNIPPVASGRGPYITAGDGGPVFSADDLFRLGRHDQVSGLPLTHTPSLVMHDGGPTFTPEDLRQYTPPKKLPFKPPAPLNTLSYPPILRDVRQVTREYSQETIEYLAKHEIRSGDPESPYVALTFDCEISPRPVLQILRTLRRENIRATFFVLGRFAYNYPSIIRQIIADGHEIGSHSFLHPRFTDIPASMATQEIMYTEAAINWATGNRVRMRYFRFPYGARDQAARKLLASYGYQSAFWTVDAREWEPGKTEEEVLHTVQRNTHGGSIILLHCKELYAEALPRVIQIIRDKNLLPGTLSDVLTDQDRHVPDYPLPSPP